MEERESMTGPGRRSMIITNTAISCDTLNYATVETVKMCWVKVESSQLLIPSLLQKLNSLHLKVEIVTVSITGM